MRDTAQNKGGAGPGDICWKQGRLLQ